MPSGALTDEVRSFNRIVTQRVGALDDHYLGRDRPLGQDRVLWEIGTEGCEVRALRSRLGLDAGHLSRLLRALEVAGLVVTEPSTADARIRVARLTTAGLPSAPSSTNAATTSRSRSSPHSTKPSETSSSRR